jgi:hypothetical protein
LQAPLKLGTPAKIFLDSMSDLMGKWIPDEQVEAVLDICRQAHWHTFQLLTKNAPRLLQFRFPPNVWVGVSAPPSWMLGKQLTADQQRRMVERQCEVLAQVNVPVRWMSIEPLSFDIAPLLKGAPLEWAVIGAATNGKRTYQPRAEWIQSLLELFDQQGVKVFFKGNLEWQPWREEFPTSPVQATPQELPLDIRPNPASYLEPPVKPKRSKRSAAQALGKRAVPSVSAASVTSAAQAAPIQAPAHDAQESVTPIALAEPSAAQANGAHESVTSAALAEPSAVQANGAHESVTSAALAEPSAAQANGAHESVTSGEQAERSEQGEPMQAPAQGEIAKQSASVTSAASVTSGEQADHAEQAEPMQAPAHDAPSAPSGKVINVELMRRGDSYDIAGTLRMIGSDILLSDATVMALDVPIATYRAGELAPELVTLARSCTMPLHVVRSSSRTMVAYLLEEFATGRRVVLASPIGIAAKRLRECGARVIEAMPYERYERYLIAARRKRDAAERQAIEAFERAHAERVARLEMSAPLAASAPSASAPSLAPAQAEQAAPSLSVTRLAVSVTTARAETAKTRVSPATLARAIALDHAIAALESRLAELRAERAKLLAELVSDPSAAERTTAPRAAQPDPRQAPAHAVRTEPPRADSTRTSLTHAASVTTARKAQAKPRQAQAQGKRAKPSAAQARAELLATFESSFGTTMYQLKCAVCGKVFHAHRADAKTCSATCRKRLSRANGAE